ncbi:RTA-like protein [Penicillium canariense]|uniref:RTA-like protein n=1 Tax=Penicillium canariense TaxID=189055 RepID=A0A9W9IME4_9EURO|nr:RTA-like protein [Penicillium canariense]KAJ5176921.1 RTA-like protein [Penicillium canariense]
MTKLEPYRGGYYLWKYIPSLAAAIIFLLLFIAATAFHSWKLYKTKARFCIAFVLGGIFEVIGYIARAAAHNRTGSVMPYSIQNVFLLLGPTLFAASVYMALGRIIRCVQAEKYSLIRINWLTKVFVMGDVLSFVVQGGASGLMVSGNNAKLGSDIVVAGLVIQVIMFCFFIGTTVVFQVRMHRFPTTESFNGRVKWKSHLRVLYAISLLVLIRSLFRVVEYVEGNDGYPLTHEWTLYVFDSILMLAVMAIWAIWHPGILQESLQSDRAPLSLRSLSEDAQP